MDIYFREEYAKICELNGEGKAVVFTDESELGKVRYIFLKREIDLLGEKYYDISTPYGYGGPQFFPKEPQNLKELILEFKEKFEGFCSENKIISEFVRFHPLLKNHNLMGNCMNIINIGNTINLYLNSEEEIFSNVNKSGRREIRKAIKKGVKIEIDNTDESWDRFIELYYRVMDKNEAERYYYFPKSYFDSVRCLLKEKAQIFNMIYDNRVISSMIIFLGDIHIHSHLLGSDLEYRKEGFERFFDYSVAVWGLKNGYKNYHLGGGCGGREDSLFEYKKSLSKNGRLAFYIGQKIHDRKIYDELTKINEENRPEIRGQNSDYFPLYRR